MFSLAHLSDVHLGPLPPGALWRNFQMKRPIGYLSWRFNRRKLHDPLIAAAIAADIKAAAPDHVAFTGDMVNISAWAEFPVAARWIAALGSPEGLSFVPGNHDTYVNCPWEYGLGHFAPWMTGDMEVERTETDSRVATPFPFVRLRKNVALIGLCSARLQPLRRAAGRLGSVQLESLAPLLRDLRERGYARVVMIHHPPLPGLAPPRKALEDAEALHQVLLREGAELVLHGHNHQHMLNPLATRHGTCHVIGVPSASMHPASNYPPAAWYLYRIERQDGRWLTAVTVRSIDPASLSIVTTSEFGLST
ncbi:MAG: metallophosphoesterase [Rhizobiales bacterium]|nr:metallophosphoesterase [Hyphomicrobiales bacterium]